MLLVVVRWRCSLLFVVVCCLVVGGCGVLFVGCGLLFVGCRCCVSFGICSPFDGLVFVVYCLLFVV